MLELEIRERVRDYIEDGMAAAELEDWLENESWDEAAIPTSVRRLAGDVLRLLAEHRNGDWTDAELKGQLGVLSRTYWFEQAQRTTRAGSGSSVIHRDQQSATAGRWRVAESV